MIQSVAGNPQAKKDKLFSYQIRKKSIQTRVYLIVLLGAVPLKQELLGRASHFSPGIYEDFSSSLWEGRGHEN